MYYPESMIDELGKIFILPVTKDELGWGPGTILAAWPAEGGSIVRLTKATGQPPLTCDGLDVSTKTTPTKDGGVAVTVTVRENATQDIFYPQVADPQKTNPVYVQIDDLGRIALPPKLRKQLGWHFICAGDSICIQAVEGGLCLFHPHGLMPPFGDAII